MRWVPLAAAASDTVGSAIRAEDRDHAMLELYREHPDLYRAMRAGLR
ncbi:hypothetical protein ACIRL2_51065 [Embleya sp. NPDC127516]